jgi:hypothetical protein
VMSLGMQIVLVFLVRGVSQPRVLKTCLPRSVRESKPST